MADVIIFSAGSLRFALTEIVERLQAQGAKIVTHFAPAGLLRERIEQNAPCDIFISADRQNVDRLAERKPIVARQHFAHNRLVVTVPNRPPFQQRSALELLLDPTLTVGTSTPLCDPSGDYTWQLFDRIENAFPTHGERLKKHAKQLVGGRQSVAIPPDQIASSYLIAQGMADIFIGYAHYANRLADSSAFLHKTFPPEWEIIADYDCALLNERPEVRTVYQQLTSEWASDILQKHGFLP